MYYVYLLLCEGSRIYTGITHDLSSRLIRHQQMIGSQFTRQHKAREFLYTEVYKTRTEAARRERQIKGWRKEKKLNLIKFSKPVVSVPL